MECFLLFQIIRQVAIILPNYNGQAMLWQIILWIKFVIKIAEDNFIW